MIRPGRNVAPAPWRLCRLALLMLLAALVPHAALAAAARLPAAVAAERSVLLGARQEPCHREAAPDRAALCCVVACLACDTLVLPGAGALAFSALASSPPVSEPAAGRTIPPPQPPPRR